MQSKLPLVLLLLVVSGRAESQRPGGAWHQTPDQASVMLELDALHAIRGPALEFRPVLYLRCHDEQVEAFVAMGAVLDRDSDYRTPVRLRWGGRPPVAETWRRSTDYAAIFAPAPAAFIGHLVSTPDLVLEVGPHDAGPFVVRFDGAGLDTHLPRLTSQCRGWPAPPAAGERAPAGVTWPDTVFAETEVDERARLLSVPEPEYPRILRRAGIQGRVIVQLVVDTLGRVEPGSLRVVSSSNPAFNRPALSALGQAVFRPARLRERAVRVRVRLPIEFTVPE
jgi:TonB family protein